MHPPSPPDRPLRSPERSDNPLPFAPPPPRRVSWLWIVGGGLGLLLAVSVLYGASRFVLRRVVAAVEASGEGSPPSTDELVGLKADDKSASLVIATTPPRATVRLGEEVVGTTPMGLSDLPAGPAILSLELDGYEPFTRALDLRAGEVESVDVALVSKTAPRAGAHGLLSLSTTPSGVKVYLDGELLGTTPLRGARVHAGIVRLDVELPSGEKVPRAVFVQANQETRTHLPLVDAPTP